ncbi:hypothetical protein ACIO6U_17525 [Streptomyces sp. NPDC087422]|uniref:hypothetical protein n=1 Tax=Streptomyces sp. NPDC087422 TaxID=3365786 RepID=UPI003826B180
MSDDLAAPDGLPWHWEWVPDVRPDDEEYAAWTAHIVALFADWTSEGLDAARLAWPAEAGVEFPFTSDMVGQGAAAWLLHRAGQLPAWSRLAWGAAFVQGSARWAPVPVVVEFRRPREEDPNYLMEVVGASGRDGDARQPTIDYVTTPIGDGVQVFALGRTPEGAAFGRAEAAMRLDVPPVGGAASVSSDVVLTTVVFEMGLMALISAGVEQLMQQIAHDCAPPADGGPARLGFATTTEGSQR